jgi:hypothetical protein
MVEWAACVFCPHPLVAIPAHESMYACCADRHKVSVKGYSRYNVAPGGEMATALRSYVMCFGSVVRSAKLAAIASPISGQPRPSLCHDRMPRNNHASMLVSWRCRSVVNLYGEMEAFRRCCDLCCAASQTLSTAFSRSVFSETVENLEQRDCCFLPNAAHFATVWTLWLQFWLSGEMNIRSRRRHVRTACDWVHIYMECLVLDRTLTALCRPRPTTGSFSCLRYCQESEGTAMQTQLLLTRYARSPQH